MNKKTLIISLVLLWVWLAITLSTDYYAVSGKRAVKASEIKLIAVAGAGRAVVFWKREPRVDSTRLVWLLLPPILGFPILRRLWRRLL